MFWTGLRIEKMDSILQIVLLFGAIGFIVAVIILTVYVLIAVINKKLGFDVNGNQIRQIQVQQQQQMPVIRIENVTSAPAQQDKSVDVRQIAKETTMFSQSGVEDDIPPFIIKNPEDVKIETSFSKKRIGKVENKQ